MNKFSRPDKKSIIAFVRDLASYWLDNNEPFGKFEMSSDTFKVLNDVDINNDSVYKIVDISMLGQEVIINNQIEFGTIRSHSMHITKSPIERNFVNGSKILEKTNGEKSTT